MRIAALSLSETGTGAAVQITGNTGIDTITITSAIGGAAATATIDGGSGADQITLAGSSANYAVIHGGVGLDTINLGAAHTGGVTVQLDGGVGAGSTTVSASTDADTITNFLTTVDHISLAGGIAAATGKTVAEHGGESASVSHEMVSDTIAHLGALGVTLGDTTGVHGGGASGAAIVKYAVATDTGAIFYDADGNWTTGSYQIGTVGTVTIVAADFLIA